jgi:hypothetical protein
MHLWKMLDFSALLSKVLYAFAFVVFWINYDLYVVFYVGFCNLRKINAENQCVKNGHPMWRPLFVLICPVLK